MMTQVPVIISAWGRRGWRAPRLSSRPRERGQAASMEVAHEEADGQEGPIPEHRLRASQYLAADARAKGPGDVRHRQHSGIEDH